MPRPFRPLRSIPSLTVLDPEWPLTLSSSISPDPAQVWNKIPVSRSGASSQARSGAFPFFFIIVARSSKSPRRPFRPSFKAFEFFFKRGHWTSSFATFLTFPDSSLQKISHCLYFLAKIFPTGSVFFFRVADPSLSPPPNLFLPRFLKGTLISPPRISKFRLPLIFFPQEFFGDSKWSQLDPFLHQVAKPSGTHPPREIFCTRTFQVP